MAHAAERCGRALRSRGDARCRRHRADDHLRHQPGHGRSPSARRSRSAAADDPVFDKALAYMGFEAGAPIQNQAVNVVFIGSCTNGRLSDLRGAARVLRGRKVARGVQHAGGARIAAGQAAAEAEGLDRVFIEAGAEWRESGCSMCIGMNGDNVGTRPSTRSAPAIAISRAARVRARAPCWPARSPPRPAPCAAASPTRANCSAAEGQHGTCQEIRARTAVLPSSQHRHRPDHSGALPAHHHARGARQAAVPRLALRPGRRAARASSR